MSGILPLDVDGTYWVDCMVFMKRRNSSGGLVDYIQRPPLLVNGQALTLMERGSNYFRIQGPLTFPLNFEDYPRSSQHLRLIMRDYNLTQDSLQYLPLNILSGVDSDVLITNRWRTESTSWELSSFSLQLPRSRIFSAIRFSLSIHRSSETSLLLFIPPIALLLIILISSSLPTKQKALKTRIKIGTSVLISLVFFQSDLPTLQVGTISLLDMFILQAYVFILLTFLLNIVIGRCTWGRSSNKGPNEQFWSGFGQKLEWVSWIVAPLAFAPFFERWWLVIAAEAIMFCIVWILKKYLFPMLGMYLAAKLREEHGETNYIPF